jgi:hypothetical protein
MWLQFQLVPETYGSRGGGGFFFLSWRSLIVPPMMLPPMSSNCQTLPNAAFILSFAGSPAYTPADEQSDWSFLQMHSQRTSQIIWWLVHPWWTFRSTSCSVTQFNFSSIFKSQYELDNRKEKRSVLYLNRRAQSGAQKPHHPNFVEQTPQQILHAPALNSQRLAHILLKESQNIYFTKITYTGPSKGRALHITLQTTTLYTVK